MVEGQGQRNQGEDHRTGDQGDMRRVRVQPGGGHGHHPGLRQGRLGQSRETLGLAPNPFFFFFIVNQFTSDARRPFQ